MPDDLVDAVVSLVQSQLVRTGALTWFGTGANPDPTTAALPYAELGAFDEDAEYQSSDPNGSANYDDRAELPITIYAAGSAEAKTLGRQLAAALNDAPLSFGDGELLYLRRASKGAAPTLDPDPGPGGGDCWSLVVTFRAISAKTS